MKLVAEQIKLLREKKKELLQKRAEFTDYLTNHRENDKMDGIGNFYTDFAENESYRRALLEIDEIDRELAHAEIITDRNFDLVDIGTGFFAKFDDDDETERVLLVEKGIANTPEYHMVSLDSDFGRAVRGAKDGERIVYTVQSTGSKIGVTVEEIDRIAGHYEHFIREKKHSDRMTDIARKDLQYIRAYDPEEFANRQRATASQKELIKEELKRNKQMSPAKRAELNKVLAAPTAVAPKGHIGTGSIVNIAYEDENGEYVDKEFEMINQAYSTELESQYVEKTSPLGFAIFGKRVNDTFTFRKNNKNLSGVITNINDQKNKEARVK